MSTDPRPEATSAARLGALASGLALDAGIRIEVARGEWSWDSARRVLTVAEEELRTRGTEHCAGVVAHEVGHYFISRYNLFRWPEGADALLRYVMNALEDPRVERWMIARYPGVARWLAVADRAYQNWRADAEIPAVIRFGRAAIEEVDTGWRRWRLAGQFPAVGGALDATREPRRRYAERLPPVHLDAARVDFDIAATYARRVWPQMRAPLQPGLADAWERAVQCYAYDAFRIAVDEILPHVQPLLADDFGRLARGLQQQYAARAAAEMAVGQGGSAAAALVQMLLSAARREGGSQAPATKGELASIARRLIGAVLGQVAERPTIRPTAAALPAVSHGRGRPVAHRKPSGPAQASSALRLPPYETLHAKVSAQVDAMVREVESVLRPRRRLRERAGYPSGTRVDLRSAMRFDADPRDYHKLWRRKSVPDRRDTAFSVLVDLSGSMREDKIQAAQAALVVLAETLDRLAVAYAIKGFQDALIPVCAFGAGLSPRARQTIAELPREVTGTRAGGHNAYRYNDDGPCLAEAAAQLLQCGATDRVLIVVSDGLPEGRRSNAADLRRVIRDIAATTPAIHLIGVGIGPGTEHVDGLYPVSFSNVPVAQFADRMGGLLRQLLIGGRHETL